MRNRVERQFVAPLGVSDELEAYAPDKVVLTTKNGMKYYFDDSVHKQVTRIVDRYGDRLDLAYSGDLLSSIRDSSGRRIDLEYDEQGRLITVIDRDFSPARKVALTYDGDGNLARIQNPMGGIIQYSYASDHRLTQIQNPRGDILTITYDSADRVASLATGTLATTYSYERYEDGSRRTLVTDLVDGQNVTTAYYYNSDGYLEKVVDALGQAITNTWEANNLVAFNDPLGHTTRLVYDGQSNILMTVDPLDGVTTATYDPAYNQRTSTTDQNGNTWQVHYTLKGDTRSITDPLNNSMSFVHDSHGHLLQVIYPEGNTINYTYDLHGRKSMQTDALENTYAYTYDPSGNLLTITDPLGGTRSFAYDSLDRLTGETDQLGRAVQFAYDAMGNVIRFNDTLGRTQNYTYDDVGRLLTVTDPIGAVTQYTYTMYNLKVITDALGQRYHYSYDDLGRRIAETSPLGFMRQYTYDARGLIVNSTAPDGSWVRYDYDALGRLIARYYPNGERIDFTYDAVGNGIEEVCPDLRLSYTYDRLNRLIQVRDLTHGKTIEYAYDRNGNVVKLNVSGEVTTYTYDANNQLVRLNNPRGDVTKYSYDPGGRLTEKAYPNGMRANYTYDAAGQLLQLRYTTSNGSTLYAWSCLFDLAGNKIRSTDKNNATTEYRYDRLDRLVNESYPDGSSVTYTYDAVGNRLSRTNSSGSIDYTYDADNRLLSAGGVVYGWDARGNRINKTDATGTAEYHYDYEGRLSSVAHANGSTTTYSYYPDGKRLSTTIDGVTVYYLYDGLDSVVEYHESGESIRRYTSDRNCIDSLISLDVNGSTYYYIQDPLGSVVALVNPSQEVVATYRYDAFGQLLDATGSIENTRLYTGREFEDTSGLYYLRSRYYDPETGRFITPDPFSAIDPVKYDHRYSYARNNPVTVLDPLGLAGFWENNIDYWETEAQKGAESPNTFFGTIGGFGQYALAKTMSGINRDLRDITNLFKSGWNCLKHAWQIPPLFINNKGVATEPIYLYLRGTYGPGGAPHVGVNVNYMAKDGIFHIGIPETAATKYPFLQNAYDGGKVFCGKMPGCVPTAHYFPLQQQTWITRALSHKVVGPVAQAGTKFLGAAGNVVTAGAGLPLEVFVLAPISGTLGCNSKDSDELPTGTKPTKPNNPGGDHPDDSFDVSTLTFLAPNDGFDAVMRLATAKNLSQLLLLKSYADHYAAFENFTDLRAQKEEVLAWSNASSELSALLSNNAALVDEELRTAPDVAVLARGFYTELSGVLSWYHVPFRLVDPATVSAISQEVLVLPSGGLYGLDSSPSFKTALDDYVTNGGTLVVFAQQRGYEFRALPGGEVSGYGWLEDQSCHYRSIGISTYHMILSGQDSVLLDANVDGYFTSWPDNASVLLTRTKNGMPALLMYEYGAGRVIVTSIYEDWAYGHHAASDDGLRLIRDLIAGATEPTAIPEYDAGKAISIPVNVTNHANETAEKVSFVLINPDRGLAKHVNVTGVSILPSETVTITFTDTASTPLGIWSLDALLYNDSALIQSNYDAQRFAVSLYGANPKGFVTQSGIQLWVTSIDDHVAKGSEVVFTVHVKNDGDTDFTGNIAVGGHEARHEGGRWWVYYGAVTNITVPAHAQQSFLYTHRMNYSTSMYFGLFEAGVDYQYTWFHSGARAVTEKGVWVFSPSVDTEVVTDQQEYAKGDAVAILLHLTNKRSAACNTTVTVLALDPYNTKVFEDTLTFNVSAYDSVNQTLTFSAPSTAEYGTYLISAEAFTNGEKIGSGSTYFVVPKNYIVKLTFDKPGGAYKVRDNMSINLEVTNSGSSSWDSYVNLSLPLLAFENSTVVSLNANETASLTYDLSIPETASAGKHEVTVMVSFDDAVKQYYFVIPDSKLTLTTDKQSYSAGETIMVNLTNSGGIDAECNCSVALYDRFKSLLYENLTYEFVKAGEITTLLVELPDQLVEGHYHFTTECKNLNAQTTLHKDLMITGVHALLDLVTDKKIYSSNENVTTGITITNLNSTIANATLNVKITYSKPVITVDDDGVADYHTIQDAVDNASAGDTILVYDGTYNEDVVLDKQLNLIGADWPEVVASDTGDGITVNADGCVIDGFSSQSVNGNGIVLYSSNNVISNNRCSNSSVGIYLDSSSNNNSLTDNFVYSNTVGIWLDSSGNNMLSNNTAYSNSEGISLYYASNSNSLTDNFVYSNTVGIWLYSSSNNTLMSNTASANTDGISLYSSSNNNTLTSNTASANEIGISLYSSSNNTLTNNTASLNAIGGFWLYLSSNNTLTNNTASFSTDGEGISLQYSSNNTFTGNNVSNNDYGMYLSFSSNNTLGTNNILDCYYGIELYHYSSDNQFYLNNFIGNDYNAEISTNCYNNTWSSLSKITYMYNGTIYINYIGNYWSNYTGSDNDGDGIGNTPYVITGSYEDRYPLMQPFESYTILLIHGLSFEEARRGAPSPETFEAQEEEPEPLSNERLQPLPYRIAVARSARGNTLVDALYYQSNESSGRWSGRVAPELEMYTDTRACETPHERQGQSNLTAHVNSLAATIWETNMTLSIPESETTTIDIVLSPAELQNSTGKLYVVSKLYSETSQIIAKNSTSFYITPDGLLLILETDKSIYKAGENIKIYGEVQNNAELQDTCSLMISQSGYPLYSDSFVLAPSEHRTFELNLTAEYPFILTGLVKGTSLTGAEVSFEVTVAEPAINAEIVAPDVVGLDPFSAGVLIENSNEVEAHETVQIGNTVWYLTLPGKESQLCELTLNISKNATVIVQISGDVNQTLEKEIICAENATLLFDTAGLYFEGLVEIPLIVHNTGISDTRFNATFTIGEQKIIDTFAVPKNESVNATLLINLTKGIYRLNYTTPFETGSVAIGIAAPKFVVIATPANLTGDLGEEVTADFTVRNTGGAEGRAELNVTIPGIYKDTNVTWLKPNEEQTLGFTFSLPDDLEEKYYKGYYELDEQRGEFSLFVQGANISVTASLDKRLYEANESAILTLGVVNNRNRDLSLYSRVRFNAYDNVTYFNLAGMASKTLTFDIPVTFTGDANMLFTVYTDSGRALHIDTLHLHEKNPAGSGIEVYTEKPVYALGENVTVFVNVSRAENFTMSAPNSTVSTTLLNASTTYTFTIPELRSGTYYIEYTFGNYSAVYPFNVLGYAARILAAELDRVVYQDGDTLTLHLVIDANRNMTGLLRVWFFDPLYKLSDSFALNVTLTTGENELGVRRRLSTDFAGMHQLSYGIYSDLKADRYVNLASGTECFDVELLGLNEVYLRPQNCSARYGNTVDVEIWANTAEPFAGGQIQVTYDSSCANVTNCAYDTALWNGTWDSSSAGREGLVFLRPVGAPTINGSVLIGTLTIQCCNTGDCVTPLTFSPPCTLHDPVAGDLVVTWTDGRFECTAVMCGDVTCDDTVDVSDVGRLLYHVGFPGDPRYPICNDWAADVNCDNEIDVSDVGLLLYHVGFPGDPRYALRCCGT